MKRSKLIALTGGIGSGKSAVAQILQDSGYFVLDCDQITKQLYERKRTVELIIENFGQSFVLDGKINIPKFGAYVFSNEKNIKRLNSIMHPLIFDELAKQIEQSNQEIVFVQIPLLFETGWQDKFDDIWLVTALERTRIERVKLRDNLDEIQIKNRIKNQMSDEKKAAFAHTIINNDGDFERLKTVVKNCVKGL